MLNQFHRAFLCKFWEEALPTGSLPPQSRRRLRRPLPAARSRKRRPEPKQRRRETGPGDPRTQRSLCVPGPFALLGRGCQQHTQLQQTPHRDYPDERDVVTSGCSAGGSGRKDDVRGNSKWELCVADSLLWTCYFLTRSCDISRIASSIITAAITILLCCSGSDNSPDILLP